MSIAQTLTRRILRGALALALAIAFMPITAWSGASQAAADEPASSSQRAIPDNEPANSMLRAYVPPIPDQVYTGTEITPKPTVMLGGKTLTEGTDYTLRYTSNIIEGTANIEITGKGAYTGKKTVTFDILQAQITSVSLSETRFYYDGTRKTPTVTVKCGDKVLVNGSDYFIPGVNNLDLSSVGTHTLTVKGTHNYAGQLTASFEILEPTEDEESGIKSPANDDSSPTDPNDPGIEMYRIYNPNSGEHFYTASEDERDHLISIGWEYEMVGWMAPSAGDAVYRLYNPNGGEHHYTLSSFERDSLVEKGWNYEGIGWYSDSTYGVPLYRQYNPNEYANNHNYTSSEYEFKHNLSLGWRDEGIAWYGVASTT